MGQTLRIDGDMAFDARDFLACIVALQLRTIGVFDALCINDQEAGHGVASLFGTGRANLIFLKPAPRR